MSGLRLGSKASLSPSVRVRPQTIGSHLKYDKIILTGHTMYFSLTVHVYAVEESTYVHGRSNYHTAVYVAAETTYDTIIVLSYGLK